MTTHIWIETGGDTGGAEVYCSDRDAKICRIDWDDWNDDPDQWPLDDLIAMMGTYGGIMPAGTRREVSSRIQQYVDELQERAHDST